MDENAPVKIANVITRANGRSTSPASSTSASVVAIVVPWVSTERGSVSLIDRFRISYRFWRRNLYEILDRKSTRLNSSHGYISYAVFCLKKKKKFGTALRMIVYQH